MRTPREIARALGWPEAHRAPDHVHYPLPTTTEITAGVESSSPLRLRITHSRVHAGTWVWRVLDDNDWWLDSGRAPSQPAALALGLAALEAAHARTRR